VGARLDCPPGKRVVGIGFSGLYRSNVWSIVPDATLTSVRVSGFGSVYLEAMCVDGTAAVGLELVSAFSANNNSDPVKSVYAACPAGKLSTGVGGWLSGGGTGRVLNTLDPFSARGVAADAYEDENGYVPNWSVTSHAICAPA
jgi:hypothetical protein